MDDSNRPDAVVKGSQFSWLGQGAYNPLDPALSLRVLTRKANAHQAGR